MIEHITINGKTRDKPNGQILSPRSTSNGILIGIIAFDE
jgi:hypothetical protein